MNVHELENILREFYNEDTELIDMTVLDHFFACDLSGANSAYRALAHELLSAARGHNAVVAGERAKGRRARWLWLVIDAVMVFAPVLALMS